jgi:hypothetical protein
MEYRYGVGLPPFAFEPYCGQRSSNSGGPINAAGTSAPVTVNHGGTGPQSTAAVGVSFNITPTVRLVVGTN